MTILVLLRVTLCSECKQASQTYSLLTKTLYFPLRGGGRGQEPHDLSLDPPLSSLLMKPQAKIDNIYLSVFEEMKNPK